MRTSARWLTAVVSACVLAGGGLTIAAATQGFLGDADRAVDRTCVVDATSTPDRDQDRLQPRDGSCGSEPYGVSSPSDQAGGGDPYQYRYQHRYRHQETSHGQSSTS